jgi:hypothetical protein
MKIAHLNDRIGGAEQTSAPAGGKAAESGENER